MQNIIIYSTYQSLRTSYTPRLSCWLIAPGLSGFTVTELLITSLSLSLSQVFNLKITVDLVKMINGSVFRGENSAAEDTLFSLTNTSD